MHRGNNIFYNAVKEDENHTTELFCNLFKYDYIRDSFFKFFNQDFQEEYKIPVEKIKYQHFETQKRIEENNKQPDIIIKTNEYKCFFEIKTNNDTKLQPSQITDYPIELERVNNKNLLFIIPKNYKHNEDIENLKKDKKYVELIYWEDFIKYVENTDLYSGNILVTEFITYLKRVLKIQDLSLTLNLNEMVLLQNSKDMAIAFSLQKKIKGIIDSVGKKIIEKTELDSDEKDDDNEYSFTFKNKDKDNGKSILFFGLWYGMIDRYEGNDEDIYNYLFCFGVGSEKCDEEYDNMCYKKFKELSSGEKEKKEIEGYLIRKFNKYDLADENEHNLINNISQKLLEIIKEITKQKDK